MLGRNKYIPKKVMPVFDEYKAAFNMQTDKEVFEEWAEMAKVATRWARRKH